MKVRAKQLGYYNHERRREGQVFELLDEKDFSKKWMQRLEDPIKPKPSFIPKALQKGAGQRRSPREIAALSEVDPKQVMPSDEEGI